MLAGEAGGLPADCWAFGTVLWELMTWAPPFDGLNPYQVRHHMLWCDAMQTTTQTTTHTWPCGCMCTGPLAGASSVAAVAMKRHMPGFYPQIINTVQAAERGSGLAVPPQDQLPAGPLGQYADYVALMEVRACLLLMVLAGPLAGPLVGGIRFACCLACARAFALANTPHLGQWLSQACDRLASGAVSCRRS